MAKLKTITRVALSLFGALLGIAAVGGSARPAALQPEAKSVSSPSDFTQRLNAARQTAAELSLNTEGGQNLVVQFTNFYNTAPFSNCCWFNFVPM
jgi:hypothetical protein